MASIARTPLGTYKVRWRDPDGRARAKTCESKTSADRLRRRAAEAEEQGVRLELREELPAVLEVAFRDVVRDWRRTKAESSVHTYAYHLAVAHSWMVERLRSVPRLDDLNRSLLFDLHHHLHRDRGAGLTWSAGVVRTLHQAWIRLYDSELHGPATPRPPLQLELPQAPGRPVQAPTWAQVDAAIREIRGVRAPWHRQAGILMRYTGLRVGQVVRLTWADLDLDQAVLVVRGELGKSHQERRGRAVPISPHLVDELAGWGVREGPLFPPTLVLPHARRTKAATDWQDVANSLRVAIRRAWAASGAPAALWSQRPDHAFRKAFRTELLSRGAAPHAIDALLGHSGRSAGDVVYTDAWGLDHALRTAVALIPAVGQGGVVALRQVPR